MRRTRRDPHPEHHERRQRGLLVHRAPSRLLHGRGQDDRLRPGRPDGARAGSPAADRAGRGAGAGGLGRRRHGRWAGRPHQLGHGHSHAARSDLRAVVQAKLTRARQHRPDHDGLPQLARGRRFGAQLPHHEPDPAHRWKGRIRHQRLQRRRAGPRHVALARWQHGAADRPLVPHRSAEWLVRPEVIRQRAPGGQRPVRRLAPGGLQQRDAVRRLVQRRGNENHSTWIFQNTALGQYKLFRVSSVQRYSSDFIAPVTLSADASTVVLDTLTGGTNGSNYGFVWTP